MGEWPYTAESSGIVSGVLPPDMVIECTFSITFSQITCLVGLPKIFVGKSAKPHGVNWVKM